MILEAFDNKLNKLNGNKYSYFKQYFLFVFSYIYADEKMIIDPIKEMKQKQINKAKKFYEVYVLVPGYCYSLNLDSGSYKIEQIESIQQGVQANNARKIVEKYENN